MDGELGRRIRAARAYGQLSQVEMARKLGVSTATLIRYEKGQHEVPDLSRMGIATKVIELTGIDSDFVMRAVGSTTGGDYDG